MMRADRWTRASERLARRQGERWTLIRVERVHDDATRKATTTGTAVAVQARAYLRRRSSDVDAGVLAESTHPTLAVPRTALVDEPRIGDRAVQGEVDETDPQKLARLGAAITAVETTLGDWLLTLEDR